MMHKVEQEKRGSQHYRNCNFILSIFVGPLSYKRLASGFLVLFSTFLLAAPAIPLYNLDNLPEGRLKEKIFTLTPSAQRQALQLMNEFSIPKQDLMTLDVDETGHLFYVEEKPVAEPNGSTKSINSKQH